MYLNSFVSRTRHNFLCICSQVCISKEYFRFWSGLRGLFDNKSPIASLGLLQTSPDRMVFFNSLRGTNKPRNGAQNLLRETQNSLRGTSNHSNVILTLLRQTQKTSLRGTNYHSNVIQNVLRHTENFLRETNYDSNVTENVLLHAIYGIRDTCVG